MTIISDTPITSWKNQILFEAWTSFSLTARKDVQKRVGLWKWSLNVDEMLCEKQRKDIIDDGVLSFSIDVDGRQVMFSVWLQMGEVRAGIRVDNGLLIPAVGIDQKLRELFDGRATDRVVKMQDVILYDWIFRDGFASFDTMRTVMTDQNPETRRILENMISDRISSILSHIFMAGINIIVEGNKLQVSEIGATIGLFFTANVKVKGNVPGFAAWCVRRGIRIDLEYGIGSGDSAGDGVSMVKVRCRKSLLNNLKIGPYEDQDAAWRILDVRDIKEAE